jgi:hypothetical protein
MTEKSKYHIPTCFLYLYSCVFNPYDRWYSKAYREAMGKTTNGDSKHGG